MSETPEYLIEAVVAAVEPLRSGALDGEPELIEWKSPVPFYGDAATAKVASVALNPKGADERLTDLESLGIPNWSGADRDHLEEIAASCLRYFQHQPGLSRPDPWMTWFGHPDKLLGKVLEGASFKAGTACHIDLVPWPTYKVWAHLPWPTQEKLLALGVPTVAAMLRGMPVELLWLNGRRVVGGFESLIGKPLIEERVPTLDLVSRSGRRSRGFAWYGTVDAIRGIPLGRSVKVLGWNWNLPSSPGANGKVDEFAEWARNKLKAVW
ncbi:MAG: hypothetical protein OXH29_02615 [bacterium]|nr:hypothetical protein [bacterium]